MPDIAGTTRAQTTFLRAFRTDPQGPPPDAWPAPAVLRRWLRRTSFRAALDTVMTALRFQADFLVAAAASRAARALTAAPDTPAAIAQPPRPGHPRDRHAPKSLPTPPTAPDDDPDDEPTNDEILADVFNPANPAHVRFVMGQV